MSIEWCPECGKMHETFSGGCPNRHSNVIEVHEVRTIHNGDVYSFQVEQFQAKLRDDLPARDPRFVSLSVTFDGTVWETISIPEERLSVVIDLLRDELERRML